VAIWHYELQFGYTGSIEEVNDEPGRMLSISHPCPLIILTLGLFTLVINAAMLWLTAKSSEVFGIDFRVFGFWSAFWGALVISVISSILNLLIHDEKDERHVLHSR
jgi:uncharacterized membrane protein YvlD (DUF360 family)